MSHALILRPFSDCSVLLVDEREHLTTCVLSWDCRTVSLLWSNIVCSLSAWAVFSYWNVIRLRIVWTPTSSRECSLSRNVRGCTVCISATATRVWTLIYSIRLHRKEIDAWLRCSVTIWRTSGLLVGCRSKYPSWVGFFWFQCIGVDRQNDFERPRLSMINWS